MPPHRVCGVSIPPNGGVRARAAGPQDHGMDDPFLTSHRTRTNQRPEPAEPAPSAGDED